MLPGHRAERAVGGQHGFVAANRLFVEVALTEVVVDASRITQTDRCYPYEGIIYTKLLHERASSILETVTLNFREPSVRVFKTQ